MKTTTPIHPVIKTWISENLNTYRRNYMGLDECFEKYLTPNILIFQTLTQYKCKEYLYDKNKDTVTHTLHFHPTIFSTICACRFKELLKEYFQTGGEEISATYDKNEDYYIVTITI